jgi:hypothetical protein
MYRISVDRAKRLIRCESAGYPEAGEVIRFNEALKEAVRELRAIGPNFSMLADMRKADVIAQNDTSVISGQAQWLLKHGIHKAAILVVGALQQMQINRMAANPAFRCFTSEQEALDWLTC